MTVNEVNTDEVAVEDYKEHENEFNGRFNKTSLFILPMIDLHVTGSNTMRYLRNAFLNDEGIEHDIDRPLFVLYRVKNQREKYWLDYSKVLFNKPSYITDYYVGMDGVYHLIMFVFQIPEKWKDDISHFKSGRYSLVSKELKAKFDQYVYTSSGEKREVRTWGILNKSDSIKDEVVRRFIVPSTSIPEDVITLRRDMDSWEEIWDMPHDKEEVFHYIKEENAKAISNQEGVQT